MRILSNFIKITLILTIGLLVLNSCILDEFKADELKMKEDYKMEIVAPLFHGSFEFKNLIHNWEELKFNPGDQISVLKFPDKHLLDIPTRIFFEPTIIIKNFSIWINGDYNFSKVNFKYTVSNGAPFSLNFQMRFFDAFNNLDLGPAILPPPFLPAFFDESNYTPVETVHVFPLNNEQLQSFLAGETVQFETWFNSSDLINSQDTFLSNYPITISIIIYGEMDAKI